MENAIFYTLSTISQTLAGAFGFLVAVVLYQLQSLAIGLPGKAREAAEYRGMPVERWERAMLASDWETLASIVRGHPLPPASRMPNGDLTLREAKAESFFIDVTTLAASKNSLRHAMRWTGGMIAGCLVFLPFRHFLGRGPTWLSLSILLVAAGLACYCLRTYFPLIDAIAR